MSLSPVPRFGAALRRKAALRAIVLALALALGLLLFAFQPERIADLVFKFAFLAMVGVAAFHMDMLFVPYGRPHLFLPQGDDAANTLIAPGSEALFIKACERRNHFVIGCMIAAALAF